MQGHAPRFKHDCDNCTFLGWVGNHDAYACPQNGLPSVILRYGDDGPEYHSGAWMIDELPNSMASRADDLMREWRAKETT